MANTTHMALLTLTLCGCAAEPTDTMPRWVAPSAAEAVFDGRVGERVNAGPYTYAQIGGRWVVTMGAVDAGYASVRGFGVRQRYHSRRLGRTFDRVVFGIVTNRNQEKPIEARTTHRPSTHLVTRRVQRLH